MGVSAPGANVSIEDLETRILIEETRILIEELRKTDPEAAQCYESGRSDCLQMNWGIVPVTPAGIGNPSAAMGLVRACAFVRNLFGATRTTGAVARAEATAAALFSPNGLASEVGLIRSLSHAVASTDAGRNVGSFSLWAAAGFTTLVSGEPSGTIEGLEITEKPDGTPARDVAEMAVSEDGFETIIDWPGSHFEIIIQHGDQSDRVTIKDTDTGNVETTDVPSGINWEIQNYGNVPFRDEPADGKISIEGDKVVIDIYDGGLIEKD